MTNERTVLKGRDANIALYLTRLVASALRGESADDIPSGLSWHEVFEAAGWNSITGLTWTAVRNLSSMPSDVRNKWGQSARSTVFRRIQFDAERELITRCLIERGVDVMPLKGAEIAPLYPSPEMRSMYDNDILYGYVERRSDGLWHFRGKDETERLQWMEKARAVVNEVMISLGYSLVNPEPVEISYDTKFVKSPFLVFEMHHALMGANAIGNEYCSDPWRFARLWDICEDAGGGLGRRFVLPPEEMYFYAVVHSYKHSIHSYVGLRALSDEWVLLSAFADSMDWSRVEAMLRGADIETYEASLRSLAERALGRGELRDEDLRELTHMMRAGTYGAPEDYLRSALQKSRLSGKRFPRLDVVMTALSPDNAPKVGPFAKLSEKKLLRPLYPFARFGVLLCRMARNPKTAGAQISTFIKGSGKQG